MSERPRTQDPESISPEAQAEFDRYFRDTPEGRAALARFFRESPEGQAQMRKHFDAMPQGRAELHRHFANDPDGMARLRQQLSESPDGMRELRAAIAEDARRRQPTFVAAVRADAAHYESAMLQPQRVRSGFDLLRQALFLAWESHAFCAQVLYRLRVRLFVRGVPILPTLLHRLCMIMSQLEIGPHVVLEPGVYIPHGKVVMDGLVRVGAGTMITPWVTLGLSADSIIGPTIGRECMIGTGAKILGPVQLGYRVRVAANAVVVHDIPGHTTVAGAPAKIIRDRRADAACPPGSGAEGDAR